MQKILPPLQSAIRHSLENHSNTEIIVAYSGGVDSQALLHALVQLKQNKLISNSITVCHVNHGLSENALYWQGFAEQECAKLSVKLVAIAVNIQAKAQESLEALARDARYEALKSLGGNKSLVVTGHHSDDQTETFLLALKRGSGLKGLSAMAVESQLGQHLLVRPLLNISRQEIVNYAKAYQLDWVEDESNTDTSFDRNFIRQTVMPLLRERWPGISKTINRSASHCSAGQELLDELAEEDLSQIKTSSTSLSISDLKKLSAARFDNLIRYFLAQHNCLMPSTEQISQLKLQLQAGEDKTPMVKVGLHYLRRFKDELYLTTDFLDISDWQANLGNLKCTMELTLPDRLGGLLFTHAEAIGTSVEKQNIAPSSSALTSVCLPKEGQQVTVRFSHDNPKCLPHFRQHSRNVKKVLQELNIAPWQRRRIAFLYYDEELVSAIGYFVCQPYVAIKEQPRLLIHWNK